MNRRGIENTVIYGASHVLEKASKNSWVNWPRVVTGVKIKRGFVHHKSVVSKSNVELELSVSGVNYVQFETFNCPIRPILLRAMSGVFVVFVMGAMFVR
jgi:hypothetical protein